MNDQTKQKLKQLKLPGMLRAWKAMEETLSNGTMTHDEFLACLIDAECEERYGRKVARLMSRAKFRLRAHIADIDVASGRGIEKQLLARLSTSDWIRRSENVIITGATGSGKSFLACALGTAACKCEMRVMYASMTKLVRAFKESLADNSLGRVMKQIARQDLLVIDDFGLEPVNADVRRWLLEMVEDRYEIHSTIIATQLPVSTWPSLIGDPTFSDAIIDRVVHNAHRIELIAGKESRRVKKGLP